jgi:phage-related protein
VVTFPSFRAPSGGASETVEPRVLEAEFGDGYFQRAGDGLNALGSEFTVVWDNLEADEADTLVDFLRARAGVEVIDWTPPRYDAAIKVVAPRWTRTANLAGFDTVAVTFRQVFDL